MTGSLYAYSSCSITLTKSRSIDLRLRELIDRTTAAVKYLKFKFRTFEKILYKFLKKFENYSEFETCSRTLKMNLPKQPGCHSLNSVRIIRIMKEQLNQQLFSTLETVKENEQGPV